MGDALNYLPSRFPEAFTLRPCVFYNIKARSKAAAASKSEPVQTEVT
jgi:hypothetical protein